MKKKIHQIFIAHRFEFTPVTIAIVLSGMVLNIKSLNELFSLHAILIFVIVNIATYWGSIYNVYYDYELDKKSPIKNRLSKSIDSIGKFLMTVFLVIEPIIFLALGLLLSYLKENYVGLILLLIGTFFTVAYSKEPLKFKRRGILNSASLFLIIMFLPPIYGYINMGNSVNLYHILLILGLAFVEYGLGLYYTTVDYTEDKQDRIKTPSVILGVRKSVIVSLLLILMGIALYIGSYMVLSPNNIVPLIISISGTFISFFWIIIYYFKGYGSEIVMEKIIKKNENFIPLWVAISAFSVLIANLIYILK
ncbi:MAG: UbiA family prenyltransferase [Bacteroidales bacterium]|jgi:4-hydroxybenzoate polyprenyltransferase|nr:UbiA family prenyltransferase [Bacteroidales bacterium]